MSSAKKEPLNLLRLALAEAAKRPEHIRSFQTLIFEGDQRYLGLDDADWDVLTQLAMDLEYYVVDERHRSEDPSYYGDERLIVEIEDAVQKIQPTTA